MSETYTHGHHASVVASHGARTAANSCGYLLPLLEPGMSLLDIGCGPGSITLDLAQIVAPGDVTGVDKAPAALEAARAAAHVRSDTTTTFMAADVYELPFPDDSFDVVHAHQVLQHLGDPVAALREMSRVTRPGGIVAVRDADYASMAWYPESDAMTEWLQAYRDLARRNGGEPDAGRFLLAWVHAAGLVDVVPTVSAWSYATPDQREFWGMSWGQRARHSSFADQALAAGRLDHAGLERIARAFEEWAGNPDGFFAMTHTEILARVPN